MNILVINIALRPDSPLRLFPVGLGYVVTAIRKAGIDFDLLDIDAHRYTDNEVLRLAGRKRYDVICLGCLVTGYKIVKGLTSALRGVQPSATIIAGNSVATSIPDTLLYNTEVDIAVMLEGEITIVELLNCLSRGESLEKVKGIAYKSGDGIVHTQKQPLVKDISSLPFIDYSIFEPEIYIASSRQAVGDPVPLPREEIRALPINTARGCIANCSFCYHVFKHQPYRYRRPESVVKEVESLAERYDLNYILLWDELTLFSRKQTIAFVEAMAASRYPVYWNALCRANLFDRDDDVEIMRRMKAAGCVRVGYSLESADASILKSMNKNITVEQFSRQTELLRRAGIPVGTSLVLGYPQETPETIRKTFACCRENRIYPSSGYLLPQPGSEIYDWARDNGYIDDEEAFLLSIGDRQDLHLNLTGMSDKEFQQVVVAELKKCRDALKIDLDDKDLIKTTHSRAGANAKEA
jgi:anaerobic magnesium-protoporphyrin IX monomethyl ester cyclase